MASQGVVSVRSFAAVIALTPLALAACRGKTEYVEPRTGLRFVGIPPGAFTMGSRAGEPGRRSDEVIHRVIISRSLLMSATEVTQRQWIAIMGYNPSFFRDAGLDTPVERVSWDEVQDFLRRLNASGKGRFRLPTEAEWEYACRAGTTTAYSTGDQLSKAQANYDGRYPLPGQARGSFRGRTALVASYPPNAWGLYDMRGNVWEWCADEYCAYPSGTVRDPWNRCGSPYNVIRGGSWYFGADSARSALRYTHQPQLRGFSIGFRIVLER